MSMSTHIVGFRPADAQWNRMKDIWDACAAGKIQPPREVVAFFDGESPEDRPGAEVNIDAAVEEYGSESQSGYQVDVSKLPPDIKIVRFYNSF